MRYYEEEPIEDELDRMRSRQKRRKTGRQTSRDTRTSRTAAVKTRNSRKRYPIFKILLLIAAIAIGFLFFKQSKQEDGYWTVAVFGVDSRDGRTGKGALSDVEMVASVNRKTGEIRLVSVFRDSYLKIDSEGSYDKINEAYFLGGHEQATDALRENFDLPIDDYATFNWKAVVDAINVLGGIDIEITDKEFAYINGFITETVNSTGVGSVQLTQPGMNHLDGVQAVAYARLRLMDTDFNRTERQRKVLGLAMEKMKKADFKTLRTLIGAVYPQISTSIGVDDILGLAKNADKYYIGQTSGFPFSHTETKVGKKSCVIATTLESNVAQLHAFLYDQADYQPSAAVKEISSHIAKKTGLGEPGKDTESGKNIGAQGNTGSGQSTPKQTAAAQTEAQAQTDIPEEAVTEPSEPSESEQTDENITAETEEGDKTPDETPGETISTNEVTGGPGAGSTTEAVQEGLRPGKKPEADSQPTDTRPEGVGPAYGSSGNSTSGSKTVTAGGSGNSLEAPGKEEKKETETTAALVAPGQESTESGYPNEFGPGRTAQ